MTKEDFEKELSKYKNYRNKLKEELQKNNENEKVFVNDSVNIILKEKYGVEQGDKIEIIDWRGNSILGVVAGGGEIWCGEPRLYLYKLKKDGSVSANQYPTYALPMLFNIDSITKIE